MRKTAIGTIALAIALASSACGSGISASNCDELADETIALVQRLIDTVDEEAGDSTIADFVAGSVELPSLEEFRSQSDDIDALAVELGCDPNVTQQSLAARVDELHATSELGRFIIQSLRSGGF